MSSYLVKELKKRIESGEISVKDIESAVREINVTGFSMHTGRGVTFKNDTVKWQIKDASEMVVIEPLIGCDNGLWFNDFYYSAEVVNDSIIFTKK